MSALLEFSGKKTNPNSRGLCIENEFDALDLTDYVQVFFNIDYSRVYYTVEMLSADRHCNERNNQCPLQN